MRASSPTPSGSSGGGLITTVLPHASAGPIFPAQLVSGKLNGLMHATTPTGSRMTTPLASVALLPATPGRSSGGSGSSTGSRASSAYFSRRATTSPTCRRSAIGASAPVSAMVSSTRPGHLGAELRRRLREQRAALGTAHAWPRAVEERLARGARGRRHLLDRALGGAAGEVLGGRVDDVVGPASGGDPLAADQDLVEDRNVAAHVEIYSRGSIRPDPGLSPPGTRRIKPTPVPLLKPPWRARPRAARLVRCTGSRSKRGRTCLPKVSIERRTCFWSITMVSGA